MKISVNKMGIRNFALLLCCVPLAACVDDGFDYSHGMPQRGVVFRLYDGGYEGEQTRTAGLERGRYDRVEHYIVDEAGGIVAGVKSKYDAAASEITVEGLREGRYSLLVLGIRGDERKDRARVNTLQSASGTWLEFPSDLHKPLEAEYYYSQTPFTVAARTEADGVRESASIQRQVVQKRIIGRVDFEFLYNNMYVGNAVTSKTLSLDGVLFATTLSGDGSLGGGSDGLTGIVSLDSVSSLYFMPTVGGSEFGGRVAVLTRDYKGREVCREYAFNQETLAANRRNTVTTAVSHPDDNSGLMFVTAKAYAEGGHKKILQDDEPAAVYTDRAQRMFDTSRPLQLSVTDDGRLHVRFYSPRGLGGVLVKARMEAAGGEFVDLAYFDTIPAFADFYETIPLVERDAVYSTETGRKVLVPKTGAAELAGMDFKVETADGYWQRLRRIKYGYEIYWGLFGGDPDKPDGGPAGNWKGIRPVHCRESVAFMLNYTGLLAMPELERMLHDNAHRLYDDNNNPVPVEELLLKMRKRYSLQVGLIYEGNNVAGLASPTVWGVAQWIYLGHYSSAWTCSFAIHELGHVMGYGHSSAFTYGPWAEELMNNFYVDRLHELPVDSPGWLDSENNPHLYK